MNNRNVPENARESKTLDRPETAGTILWRMLAAGQLPVLVEALRRQTREVGLNTVRTICDVAPAEGECDQRLPALRL